MPPPARLLDLTRLVSRLGRGPLTGVDRVEYAYLVHLLAGPVPIYGLARTTLGFVLLDRRGAQGVADRVTGATTLGHTDLLGRLLHHKNPLRARAEADLRRLSMDRAGRFGLGRMLRRHLPAGFSYLNTGHANLSARTLLTLRQGGAAARAVLVHDTIPLDHPEYTRPGIASVFARKLAAVADHADLVIHSAQTTRTLTEAHLAHFGRVPAGVVAPLGIDLPHPLPVTRPTDPPYFVTIGTIEPRKNHALLLDIWEEMHRTLPPAQIPHLMILGHRGWSNTAVFDRLDSLPFIGQTVFERAGLPDKAVFALLAGSRGLLFPSHVEGYGLPPLEALALNVPVFVPPLPIYRETLGDYPVYPSTSDSYSWLETILQATDERPGRSKTERQRQGTKRQVPVWRDHFNLVLNIV